MSIFTIDFVNERCRSGYQLVDGRLKPNSDKFEEIRPLEFHPALYAQFGRMDEESSAKSNLIEFVNSFGPLTPKGNGNGDSASAILAAAGWFNAVLALVRKDPTSLARLPGWRNPSEIRRFFELSNTERGTIENPMWGPDLIEDAVQLNLATAQLLAMVRPSPPDGRPMLSLSPASLLDALKLQLYQAVCSGAQVKTCEWCRAWFEIGGNSGRRTTSKFCSDNCRLKSHREKRRDETL